MTRPPATAAETVAGVETVVVPLTAAAATDIQQLGLTAA